MKKFIYIAAISLAAMLSFSACEKSPDDGGNGNDTGKPGVAKPAKSMGIVIKSDFNNDVNYDFFFTNDTDGRITKVESKYNVDDEFYDFENPVIEYGDNYCRITDIETSWDYKKVLEFVMEDGKAVSGTRKEYYEGEEGDVHETQYKYDGSGYLTEIIMTGNSYPYKSITKLEWENGCLKSWYEEYFDEDNKICFRNREVFYYGKNENLISNLNPFHRAYKFGASEWEPEYLLNLLGKQSRYLPVKQESCAEEYPGGIMPGEPDEDFEKNMMTCTFKYEFNMDNTVSKFIHTYTDGEHSLDIEYTFKY